MRWVLAHAPVVVAPERSMLARRCSAQSLTRTTTPAVWLQASFFSLAQAKYSSGDFKHTVFDSVDQAGCMACRGRAATADAVPPPALLCMLWARPALCGEVRCCQSTALPINVNRLILLRPPCRRQSRCGPARTTWRA